MKRFIFSLACIALLASACVTQKKVDKYFDRNPEFLQVKAEAYLNDHPEVLAQKCTEKFPVREVVKPGKPVISRDSVPGATVPCPPSGTAQCPPIVNETITIRDTTYLEDTAKLYALEARYRDSLQSQFNRLQGEINTELKGKITAETKLTQLAEKYGSAKIAIVVLAGFLILFLFISARRR